MPVTEEKTTPENPSKAKILPSWWAGRTSDLQRAPDGALNWYWEQKPAGLHSEMASRYLFKLGESTFKARLLHENSGFAPLFVHVDGYKN